MRLLISHAIEDEPVAALLKELIERCSLRQIEVWFSSDRSAAGGIPIGSSWFPDLLQRLKDTQLVVALMTPLSVSSPWLYFECGYAADRDNSSVVPITLGLTPTDVPMPLSAYQGFDLSEPAAIDAFLAKLFALAKVPFDEEMTSSIRSGVARRFSNHAARYDTEENQPGTDTKTGLEDLRRYLEKRFVDLYATASPLQQSALVYKCHFEVWKGPENLFSFSVLVDANKDTIQSITDRCFFKIEKLVKPFTYLESWVIQEIDTQRRVVVREVADVIPARLIFQPRNTYKVDILDKPYDPTARNQFS